MARKSRKAQVQNKPVAEVKKEAAALSAAIYARLSVENSGKNDDGNSLQNQIAVCKDYLDGCPYLRLVEVYSDNGKTGTVFDRPAWNRLMEDVRTGKIQCIVVRDLSRFGRDYVETGNYLEKIFPALGTRFISIKENFDNFTCGGSVESLSVSLQNLVNAIYSRDISKKVSTALRAQMETGNFRNRHLPYGYLWNEDKTAYAVDEEAAAVVRQIFQWKRQGVSVYDIIERLKAGGVESPERHKRKAGTRSGENIQGEGWCPSTIRGILQNRAYIGELICGKSETALYKGLKKRITEKDNWIVVSDAHPPIIPIADFEAVERQMREDSSHRAAAMEWSADIRAGMIDLFDRKIFCADCGKRMYYKRQRVQCKGVVFRGVYDCSTHMSRRHRTCFNHSIRQDALNEKVFNAIRDQLQVALDYEKLLKAMRGSAGETGVREKHKAAVSSIKLRLNALKKKRAGLYESYDEGILNEEEYAFAKQTYEEQYETLSRLLDEAVERRERFAPYGFRFHPSVRNRLAIDEESAAVVRRIFDMTMQGMGSTAIARLLNGEGVPTPGAYFRMKHPDSNRFRKASEKNGWTSAAVLNILHQYEYTGALVGRKRYKASLHEKRTVPQNKADWIIYEGAHDAIISKADFDRVQEIIRQRPRRARGTPQGYPLKGLLKCGNCDRTLSRIHNSAGYYYRCTKSGADEASDCPKGKLFSEKEIEGIVFRAIMQMLAMCQERQRQKSSLMLTRKERIAACVAELQKLGQRQERYKQEKFRAYENFNSGGLTKDAYLKQRAEIDSKITATKAEQEKQEHLLSELERLTFQDKAREDDVFTTYAGATELTAELAGTFIKEVLVSSPTEIEIVWKFRDVFDMQGDNN